MAFWASNPIGTRWPALYSNHSLIVVKNWNCAEKSLGRIGLAESAAPNSPIPTFSISIWHKWKWNWQTWNSISQIQFCLPNWVLALLLSFPLVPNWYGKGIIRINGYSSSLSCIKVQFASLNEFRMYDEEILDELIIEEQGNDRSAKQRKYLHFKRFTRNKNVWKLKTVPNSSFQEKHRFFIYSIWKHSIWYHK